MFNHAADIGTDIGRYSLKIASEAHDRYFTMIKKSAFANSLENCRSEVKIERAHLGSAGSLLGSAYYGMTRLAGKSI
jgi:hypothetical protein